VRRIVTGTFARINSRLLHATCSELIGKKASCLLVHSSLSRCGYICGGEEAVIVALQNCCDTLCLPTHTYYYPQAPGQTAPIFDPALSASLVGSITNVFRMLPGVVRSIHPTHSLAACGTRSKELCTDHHKCATPCGAGTPYEKLIAWDSSVLMFGASMNTYTLFHTAEDAARCEYLYEPKPYDLRVRDRHGVIHPVHMLRQNMRIPRRFDEMDKDLQREGLLRQKRLGLGRLLFIPSALSVHQFLLDRLVRDPYYLVSRGSKSLEETRVE
jgi:aminoglycoside 3-N-acetyltransferase